MKPLLLILRTKLFLLSFLLTSTLIIATTVTLEIKNSNKKEVVAEKAEIKKEKKKTAKKIILDQLKTDGPTLTSDAADYAPGTTATLTGTGFLPNESVRMQVLHANYVEGDPIGEDHEPWYVPADENGNFTTTWHVCEDDCVGELLRTTADGQDPTTPARHAEALFTDSQKIYPDGLTTNSPDQTVCQNVPLNALVANLITCENGSNDPIEHSPTTYTWYYNGTDSKEISSAQSVQVTDATTATTSSSFTPSSASVGVRYYFCQVTYEPKDEGQNCGGSKQDGYPFTTETIRIEVTANDPPEITTGGTTTELGCNPVASDINAALGTATATDDCGGATVTPSDGAVSSDGCSRSQSRTFTAVDDAGNTATAARTVTWKADKTGPVFTSDLTTVPLSCNPEASDINAALGTAEASDACGSATVISASDGDVNSSSCSRSQTRTFTARDGCGNTSTASRTVTWREDHILPDIQTGGTANTLGCNPSASDINAALGTATATDGCGSATVISNDGDVSNSSCSRSKTRTFTARDECGNTSTASRTVTWTYDKTPPTVTLSTAPGLSSCNPAASDIDASLGTATATDACCIPTVTASDGAVISSSCSRSQTRTFTARDGCGNTSTVFRTVTWTDDHAAPGIQTGGTTTTLGCNPSASDINNALGTATATDACGTASIVSTDDGAVSSNGCSRIQKRTFSARDGCGNTSTACRTISWTEDITGPTITTGGTTTSLGCNPAASDINAALGTATATDACSTPTMLTPSDGAVSTSNCLRTQKRTFTFRDACGNTSTACRTITWTEDNTAPTFTGTFANTTLGCNPALSDIEAGLGTANATDACGSPTVTTSDAITGTCVKSKTRTFTARDGCGNTATAFRTVTWKEDTGVPVIPPTFVSQTCLWPPNHKMVDIVLAAADGCGVTGGFVKVTSSEPKNDIGDGNTAPDMDWTGTPVELSGDPYTVQGPVTANADGTIHILLRAERSGVKVLNPDDPGRTYTIYFTATDACGNTASASVSNTVTVAHNITNPVAGGAFPINTTVNFAGTFWDVAGNKHTAKWLVDATSVNGTVTAEPGGGKLGKATGSFKPTAAGVYKLRMNITDQKGVTSYATTNGDYEAYFVAYDPRGGFTYGGGQFISPAGALTVKPTLSEVVKFGFTSNYYKNATYPKGETELDFKLTSDGYSFAFNALNYEYLMVNGSKAQYKGSGKTIINGVEQGGNAFILTVIDGKNATNPTGVDKIRLKIYNKNTGAVIYDNQMGASETADPTTAVDSPKTDGTDIVVVSSTTAVSADITQNTQMEITPEVSKFNINVSPNPTEHHFTLYLEGASNEKVQLVVYDAIGRQVKKIEKGDGSGAITFGENLKVGVYFVEVRQGANRKTLKLVKQ